MKKKKLVAKLARTKRKLTATRTELDAMMDIIKASGMPKATDKPAAGKAPAKKPPPKRSKPAPAKPAAKPAARPRTQSPKK